MFAVRERVELTQEINRVEVLTPAEPVGHPLPFLARVVQVQHGRDGIHSEPIHVILLQPEQRVREQEIADLVSAVVEDQRAPVAVLSLTRILMLEERRPVEPGQPVGVLREVARDPVQDHTDVVPMALIDERLEVLR